MIKILLAVMLVIFCSAGYGLLAEKMLKLKPSGFTAPLGFVLLLCTLQLCYYPVQFFNGSVYWIYASSYLILGCLIVYSLFHIRELFKRYWHWNLCWILVSFLVFVAVFYHLFIDIGFSDSPMYLNYIAQNIDNQHLNLFNLYSGQIGAEWDALYLFQGYYHFGTFLCHAINVPSTLLGIGGQIDNIVISTWGLGMIYSLISSMLIANFAEGLKIKQKSVKYVLIAFTLFFSNFYYWRVAFAFYGNTYRTLLAAYLIYTAYCWLRDKEEPLKYVMMFIVGAGLACSSSYLFISFAILFSLAAYLFVSQKTNAFVDMSIIVLPMAVYAVAMFSRNKEVPWIAPTIAIVFIAYYSLRFTKLMKRIIEKIEEFFFRYGKFIFFVLIPILMMLFSAYVNFFKPDYLYDYAYYFNNHQDYDMVKDYYFIYSHAFDNILNVIRWFGVILILWKEHYEEQKYIKSLFVMMLILFLNPLATTAVAYLIASNVFYRTVEVLFNPFTEMLIILAVIQWLEQREWLKQGLLLILCAEILVGHIASYLNSDWGLYTFHVNGGKTVNPIVKISDEEIEAIHILEKLIERDQDRFNEAHQPTIISHAEGVRTFLPNVYQIFTARDYYYIWNRVDWIFYDLARRHYDWEDPATEDYARSCGYLDYYDVDYLIVQYWENPEFDEATEACSITEVTTSKFKLKSVKKTS